MAEVNIQESVQSQEMNQTLGTELENYSEMIKNERRQTNASAHTHVASPNQDLLLED